VFVNVIWRTSVMDGDGEPIHQSGILAGE